MSLRRLLSAARAACGVLAVILLFSFFAVVLSYLGATSLLTEPYDRASMAAWLQSIGAIGAIAGTAWTARYQANRLARDREQALFALAEAANAHAETVAALIDSGYARHSLLSYFDTAVIESMHSAMTVAPVHELRTREGVIAFLAVKDGLPLLAKAINVFLDGPDKHPTFKKILEETRANNPGDVSIVSATRENMDQVLLDNVRSVLQRIHEHHAKLAVVRSR